MQSNSRIPRFLFPTLAVLMGVVAYIASEAFLFSSPTGQQTASYQTLIALDQSRPLPPFELRSSDGAPFLLDNLKGAWNLIYFGFTHCPDICPTTLLNLQRARELLAERRGPAANDAFRTVFISVDPGRDDMATLDAYVTYFGNVVGVTGDDDALLNIARNCSVAVRIGGLDTDGEYRVDHSPAVVLVSSDGAVSGFFPVVKNVDAVADDLEQILQRTTRNGGSL